MDRNGDQVRFNAVHGDETNVSQPTQTICITFTNEAANLFPIKRFIQIGNRRRRGCCWRCRQARTTLQFFLGKVILFPHNKYSRYFSNFQTPFQDGTSVDALSTVAYTLCQCWLAG